MYRMDKTREQNKAVSPCINVCSINDGNGLCQGCFRTLDEIAFWSHATNDERLMIIVAIAQRREELNQ